MQNDALKVFAERWGCDLGLMSGPVSSHMSYRLKQHPSLTGRKFDGHLSALGLDFPGRWGNYIFQMINMFHIAERIDCKRVYLCPTEMIPLDNDITIDSIHVASVHRRSDEDVSSYLSGVFFDPRSFGDLFNDLTPNRRVSLARKYILPLMAHIVPQVNNVVPGSIVLHIRSGDIFEGPDGQGGSYGGGNLYIQPPLCFYEQVVERASAGIKSSVFIVSENALNPVIIPLVQKLDRAGHAVTLRLGQTLPADISWLLAGTHVAFANGTIGMAVALLSTSIRNAYFFRHNGTGTTLPVETYLGDQIVKHFAIDTDSDYPVIGGWHNTAQQRDLMCTFDGSKLVWEGNEHKPKEFRNIAIGKHASQSSTSTHSQPNESFNAISGVKTGSYQFHTNSEPYPWWQVDLGANYAVEEVRIYNRIDVPDRAFKMLVYVRDALGRWDLIHDQGGRRFGGIDGHPARIWVGGRTMNAVRIQLPHVEYLHLDQVEIMSYVD